MKFKLIDGISKTEFVFKEKELKLYLCGPTVYNDVHVGNIRPIITFDVLIRVLKVLGYKVHFVHNITDIDDKIINQSIAENRPEKEIALMYSNNYVKLLEELNINLEDVKIHKVIDNMESIIKYIERLEEKGFTYTVDGSVYFDVRKAPHYGELSNRVLADQQKGKRAIKEQKKEHEHDFALWKTTEKGITWKSKWSDGRPGWHTECSCLIDKFIGKQTDIHGGGIDLKFPHHENENIQNWAIHNQELSKCWMHVGHLNSINQKMSKSLNNFVLAKDLLSKFRSNSIRWFFYKTVYANPINFSFSLMTESEVEIENLILHLNKAKSFLILNKKLKKVNVKAIECLSSLVENLNFPNHVSCIYELLKKSNILLRQNNWDELNIIYHKLLFSVEILGIKVDDVHTEENIDLLNEWNTEKSKNNFAKADEIRKELIEKKLV